MDSFAKIRDILFAAMLLSIGGTVGVLYRDVATLTERLDARMTDRYRGEDARRDFALVNSKIGEMSRRLEEVETELKRLRNTR